VIKEPLIIDDIVSQQIADKIEEVLLSEADWHFISDVTFGSGADYRSTPAFGHVFKNTEWPDHSDPFLSLVMPVVEAACSRINYHIHSIQKARSFLQVPLHESFTTTKLDALHVDQQFPHLVVLYYVMDSDGDTIIVDHKRVGAPNYTLEAADFPQLVRVTPKKGRVVIFDGDYYHTAEQPKHGLRCIVNFNVLGGIRA
jgi:hypothetical protein